jgi:hypothetical protein
VVPQLVYCLSSKCRRRLLFPSWLMHLTTWHLYTCLLRFTSKILKKKITPKIGNFSDEQGLQNNFNRKYLYNSKIVVKFLTKLSLDALKKNLRFMDYLCKSIFHAFSVILVSCLGESWTPSLLFFWFFFTKINKRMH